MSRQSRDSNRNGLGEGDEHACMIRELLPSEVEVGFQPTQSVTPWHYYVLGTGPKKKKLACPCCPHLSPTQILLIGSQRDV